MSGPNEAGVKGPEGIETHGRAQTRELVVRIPALCFRFPQAFPVSALLPVQQLPPQPGPEHPAEQDEQGGDEQYEPATLT